MKILKKILNVAAAAAIGAATVSLPLVAVMETVSHPAVRDAVQIIVTWGLVIATGFVVCAMIGYKVRDKAAFWWRKWRNRP